MKKAFILLILCNISLIQYGQIIADHTIVDKYDDIPQYYIDEVKKMWLVYAGESHSGAIRNGLTLLENSNAIYAVSIAESGIPEAYTTSNLRASRGTWGDFSNASGWIYDYGEEDWWTNPTAVSRTKAGISYCNSNSLIIGALGFGWCWDSYYPDNKSTGTDPITGNHWYGWSIGSTSGDKGWGIDDADNVVSGNVVNMDDYISVTQSYIDYCRTNSIPTKVFFTTGPVDNIEGYAPNEAMYQGTLKHQRIRDYVLADPALILFDFADILCYDNDGTPTTATWNGHTYPTITSSNLSPIVPTYHISQAGALRLAKAMWWMLARMAGWDGGTTIIPGTWLGVTANWNDASNWPVEIPTIITDVIISSSAPNQPFIFSSPTAICNNLTINPGASCTINSGQTLTVNSNLVNNGTLTINSTSLTSNGSLIIKGASTGFVTYNRLMPTGASGSLYRYISSPVNSTLLPSGQTYWLYDEPNGAWLGTTSCTSGLGYTMAANGGTVSYTGTVVTSTSRTGTAPYSSASKYTLNRAEWGGGGWNLLGNPFTSAMSATTFISVNGASGNRSLDPDYQAVYIYNGSDFYYIASAVPGYNGLGTFPTYTDIQVGQGFFVLANYNGVTFNFTPAMQTHNTTVPMTKSAIAENDSWPGLQLKVEYGDKDNSTLIVYNDNMNAGLDPGYDVGQLTTGPDVEIYTILVAKDSSVNFARQALPISGADTIIVPIGIDSEKGGSVTFSAFTVQLEHYHFWLEDRMKGIFTDLSTSTYSVTLPVNTYGTGRFFIYTSTNMPTAIRPQPEDLSVRVWISDDKVIIKGSVSENAICEVYDLRGQKVLMTHLDDGELNIVNMNSAPGGAYLVRIVDGLKVTAKKVMLF
jgi:hypothetical protein